MSHSHLPSLPIRIGRKPTPLPYYTLITEDEAVAECIHGQKFTLKGGVEVCQQCGSCDWSASSLWADPDEVQASLYLYLSVQRALEHY